MRTDTSPAKGKMDVLSGRMEGGGLRESCFAEAPAMPGHEGCQEGGERQEKPRSRSDVESDLE